MHLCCCRTMHGAALWQQDMTTERQATSDSSSVDAAWVLRLTLEAAV